MGKLISPHAIQNFCKEPCMLSTWHAGTIGATELPYPASPCLLSSHLTLTSHSTHSHPPSPHPHPTLTSPSTHPHPPSPHPPPTILYLTVIHPLLCSPVPVCGFCGYICKRHHSTDCAKTRPGEDLHCELVLEGQSSPSSSAPQLELLH